MNSHIKKIIFGLIALLAVNLSSLNVFASQTYASNAHASRTFTSNSSMTNRLDIKVDVEEYTRAAAANRRYDFKKPATLSLNSGPEQALNINIRGSSCLRAKRKCFGLKIKEVVQFNGNGGLSGKNFNLISLWQDAGYISSRIGFEFFRRLAVFDIRTEYSEVFINGQSQGLYLVTEKPKKAVERITRDVVVARRNSKDELTIDEDYSRSSSTNVERFMTSYQQLLEGLNLLEGDALMTALQEQMDLNNYIYWLLGNSLLKNGDFAGEVYFYANTYKPNIYFEFMPWDFDDLFRPFYPSEKNKTHKADIDTKLLYSYESALDTKIGDDPILYAHMKQLARGFYGDTLSLGENEQIHNLIDTVKASISPYLDNPDVLNAALLDGRKEPYSKDEILNLLETRRQGLIERKNVLLRRSR